MQKISHYAEFGRSHTWRIYAAEKVNICGKYTSFGGILIALTVAVAYANIPHNAGENCSHMRKNPNIRQLNFSRICKPFRICECFSRICVSKFRYEFSSRIYAVCGRFFFNPPICGNQRISSAYATVFIFIKTHICNHQNFPIFVETLVLTTSGNFLIHFPPRELANLSSFLAIFSLLTFYLFYFLSFILFFYSFTDSKHCTYVTSSPIGAWNCNPPSYKEIMTDRPTK